MSVYNSDRSFNYEETSSMIHFDFIVNDVDAENIMGCIQTEIVNCHMKIQKCIVAEDAQKVIDAYNSRIEYLEELKTRMYNSRVE